MSTAGRRVAVAVLGLTLSVGLVGGGWWAGRTALEPPRDPLADEMPVTIPVHNGTVGRVLTLVATALWEPLREVRAAQAGVVTSVDAADGTVEEGDRLLTVDLLPVVLVSGSVPAFRDLGPGADGPDVAQMQAYLVRAGFDPGSKDGSYGDGTTRAVRHWQRARDLPVTGTVPLGAVVFTPQLPARVRLTVEVNDLVTPGQSLAEVLTDAPSFEIPVTDEQVALIPPATPVEVTGEGVSWSARTGDVVTAEDGGQRLRLVKAGGGAVCGDDCDQVPVDRTTSWGAAIELVPEITGPVVPAAAVRTAADGRQFVLTADGNEVDLDVRASADGLAVVEGVEVGTEVILPTAEP